MPYVHHRRRDSTAILAPILLAIGSFGLLALVWRRRAAPRVEQRHKRVGSHLHEDHTATGRASFAGSKSSRAGGRGSRDGDAQPASTGTGALVHRRYEVAIPLVGLQAADLLRLMQRHLTELAPSALADFTKSTGNELSFRDGDEYDITMLGPWNGRVRVTDLAEHAFTLVTLDGHPEAGHITFSVTQDSENAERATVLIESWARARDALVNVAYSTLQIGKQVQAEVWITFLQRLAALAGVSDTPQVRITTEELTTNPTTTSPDTHER